VPTPPRAIVYPEDRLPIHRLLPLGLQHVVAMFGATVLAPILMGFDPQTAVFFSGVGTLVFILVTGGRVPSYLGSSFSYIGPVLAVVSASGRVDPSRIPLALGGIALSGVLYAVAALATIRFGSRWIDRAMPPVVTGTVVALIGLNLAGSAVSSALGSWIGPEAGGSVRDLAVSSTTLAVAVIAAVHGPGIVSLIPILLGVIAGSALALPLGLFSAEAVARISSAAWLGLPRFVLPALDLGAQALIAPIFLVLLAENKGHIDAISGYLGRDLGPLLGRAYLGDALATILSACGGGTPQTTYAENMGVMAITRMFAVRAFATAAGFAILLGVCPKFGALILAIPGPVLGGVTLLLYGMITLMGVRIWQEARVDFSSPRSLVTAGVSITLATGLGVKGLTAHGVTLSGITLGTLLALALNLLLAPRAEDRGGRGGSSAA
jgi:putative pyrimidine permease RutG